MQKQIQLWKKYRVALIVGLFLGWVTFFDSYSLISYWRISRESNSLKKEAAFYKKEIDEARKKRDYLFSNPYTNISDFKNLEIFAREQYFMKKDDEDIYIILEKPE